MTDVKKPNPLLEALKKDLFAERIEEDVKLYNHVWRMQVLDQRLISWAAQFGSPRGAALAKSMEAPILAAAIQAIDGVGVQNLFGYEGLSADVIKDLEENEEAKADWVRLQLLHFIMSSVAPSRITGLYQAYIDLEKKHDKALAQLPS